MLSKYLIKYNDFIKPHGITFGPAIKHLPSRSGECFWDANPFLFGNLVLMDVNVVAKGVQITSKHKRSVHERTGVNKFTFFSDLHLLHIEYEASVEDLRSQCTLSSENHDFIVGDLVCKTHVPLDPK